MPVSPVDDDKVQASFPHISPAKNYERASNGAVLTGQQVLNLLAVAGERAQAILLLDIRETDKPATDPGSQYGVK